jgi:hypothetical protein
MVSPLQLQRLLLGFLVPNLSFPRVVGLKAKRHELVRARLEIFTMLLLGKFCSRILLSQEIQSSNMDKLTLIWFLIGVMSFLSLLALKSEHLLWISVVETGVLSTW